MSTDIYDIECVVVGAGAVGLACASALARASREVAVIEAASGIGTGTSSRNSEVIHAGIYYPTGSLKHRLCVVGRRRLYPYLAARGVAHRKCGKLIVAASAAEEPRIGAIHQTALRNDVEGVELISGAAARALEPNLNCVSALVSPETGVVDSHGFMLALQGDLENAGAMIVFNAPFVRAAVLADGRFDIDIGGEAPARIRCRALVNSAGLDAQRVARAIEGLSPNAIPKLTLAKGNYFGCAGRPAFTRLIYPAPVEGGLGVHLTLDLAGRMRFGPDVEWLKTSNPAEIDYQVDPARCESFYAAIRTYWPGLSDGALTPDYAGCRPKLSGPGEAAADFRIDGPEAHGLGGLVNLFGIESPGLTSALAIAEEVRARLDGHAPRDARALKPVVFFDRDGTLNDDSGGYTHKPEDLRFLPGAIEAIRHVNERGWLAIVVTNQSGVGRGLYDEAAAHRFHAHMQSELSRQGARIDAFYLCAHHADAAVVALRHPDHPDRKPNPGMLLRAFAEHPADPMRALIIGDHANDAAAGAAAGIAALKLEPGDVRAQLIAALARTSWGGG
jgi:histidinol-phosphate phosphatase family protein